LLALVNSWSMPEQPVTWRRRSGFDGGPAVVAGGSPAIFIFYF